MAEIGVNTCPNCSGPEWVVDVLCPVCFGSGSTRLDNASAHLELVKDSLNAKVDAIKAMLDSAIYGMQKMSSNLDDIMVKLDV